MSLLPQQTPPETVSLGTVKKDGTIAIEHNWWLFFYNLYNVVLAGRGQTNVRDILQAEVFLPHNPLATDPDPAARILIQQVFGA